MNGHWRWLAAILPIVGLASVAGERVALPAAARVDTTTITIRTTSAALAFEPDQITMKAGSIVRIRYSNESTLGHNLVILKNEDDIDAIGAASYNAGDHDFVPVEHRGKMIAHSTLASPGRTVEFTFTAPPAGKYPFVCFVDGHFNMMLGTLTTK